MAKTSGSKRSRLTGYMKLDDASKAGTREGHRCTLILTEGDSAKALTTAGLGIVGREYFGGMSPQNVSHRSIPSPWETSQCTRRDTRYDHEKRRNHCHSANHGITAWEEVRGYDIPTIRSFDDHDRSGSRRKSYQGTHHKLFRNLLSQLACYPWVPNRIHHSHRSCLEGQPGHLFLHFTRV